MNRAKLQFFIFNGVIIATFVAVDRLDIFSEQNIVLWQEWIRSLGLWAPIGFIVLYTIGTVLFLPGTIFTLIGGAAFGLFWGSVLGVIAATIGATGAHYTARWFGKDFIQQSTTKRFPAISHYKARLQQNGFLTVLVLRLTPLIPYNGLNLALAYSPIKMKDYIAGTFIGVAPGAIAYVYLGEAMATLSAQNIAIGAGGIIAYMILTALLVKRINKNSGQTSTSKVSRRSIQKGSGDIIEGEIIDE